MIADGQVNGSHARHYVAQAAGHHGAIVRFQEENAALRVDVADLRMRLAAERHRADVAEDALARVELELETVISGVAG